MRALDGVRGLASVLVVTHHLLFLSLPDHAWPLWFRWMQIVPQYSSFGVDLFFVLSGYLITSLLLLARRSPHYYSNFYWKRVFRILPALLLVLGMARGMGYLSWPEVLLALLFLANLRPLWGKPEGGPFWSLAIEEQFYLLWPAVVRRERPRTMRLTLLILIVLPACLRVLSVALKHGRMHYTFVHCDGLAWGALLALAAYRLRVPFRTLNDRRLWRTFGLSTLIGGLLCLLFAVWANRAAARDLGLLLTAANMIFTGLLAFLLTHRRAPLARLLGSRLLRFFGEISYMLYLSHVYLMSFYDQHFGGWREHLTPAAVLVRFGTVLTASVLFSAASLYIFERPLGGLRRYFLHRD